jgi:hypothetical protein
VTDVHQSPLEFSVVVSISNIKPYASEQRI